MCINLDISDILLAEKTLTKMAGCADIAPAKKEDVTQVFVKDVNELLDCLIIAMSSGLLCNNIQHWPHIKTHKSLHLAKLEQEPGASGITCAKLAEAEEMVAGGITSILLAYQLIGDDKCQRYAELAHPINMRTIVDSLTGAQGLSRAAVRHNPPQIVK